MAEIPTFDARAPRQGRVSGLAGDGGESAWAALANGAGRLAARLGAAADRAAQREGVEDGLAMAGTAQMPGVDFAFDETAQKAGGVAPSTSGQYDLTRHLTDPSRIAHLRGIKPEFRGALEQMISNAPENIRKDIRLLSGYRSPERQATLYQAALRKYGSEAAARKWVAPPGRSRHNHGDAYDLQYGSDAARQWVHANAQRFGLHFPMSHEPWHIEPIGARNGGSAPPASAGAAATPSPPPAAGVTVTLTGAASPMPRKPAGTIYSDAYNAAASQIYMNRLDAAMRAQIDALELQHADSPAELAQAIDAARAGFAADMPPPERARFDAAYDTARTGALLSAARRQQTRQEDALLASFDEAIEKRRNGIVKLAMNAAAGPTHDAAIAAELADINASIDASPMTPLQKSRARRALEQEVVSARVIGGFEQQAGPAERAEYARQFKDAWKADSGFAGRMNPETFDSIDGRMTRRLMQDEADAARRVTEIDKAIDDQIDFLEKGLPVPEAARKALGDAAAATGDENLAATFDFFDRLATWQQAHVAAPPQVIEAQIAALDARIAQDGATDAALTTRDVMDGLRKQMETGLKADPLGWADRAGVAKVAPLDMASPEALTASMASRATAAEAVAKHYGVAPVYFRPGEKQALIKAAETDPLALPQLAGAMIAGFGRATPKALAELTQDAPVIAHVAGLQAVTNDPKTTVELAEALALRKAEGYKSTLPTPAKLQAAALPQIGPALAHLPGAMNAAIETATALAEARAYRRGIDAGEIGNPDDPAHQLFLDALDQAVGGRTIGGEKWGGFTEVNGRATIAPPDMAADRLADLVSDIRADDLLLQAPIVSANGVAITPEQLQGAQLIYVAPGRYHVALGDIEAGDPRFVAGADGNRWVLDVRALQQSATMRGGGEGRTTTTRGLARQGAWGDMTQGVSP